MNVSADSADAIVGVGVQNGGGILDSADEGRRSMFSASRSVNYGGAARSWQRINSGDDVTIRW